MITIERMNEIREDLGLTYQKISLESGVPIGTVQKVLGGITRNPRSDTMTALENAFQRYERIYNGPWDAPTLACDSHAPAGRKVHWTYRDREKLPEHYRTEIINGRIYDMTSPSPMHQDIVMGVYMQLRECIRKHHASCHVYAAPLDVLIDGDDDTVVQPDVFLVCDRKMIRPNYISGAPAFILEVTSPSTRSVDRREKMVKYTEAGVKEYWMIDPDRRKVIAIDLREDLYQEPGTGPEEHPVERIGNEPAAVPRQEHSEKAVSEEEPPNSAMGIYIYGFHDRIPLQISGGKCVIDMNPIREQLDDVYGKR